MSNSPYSDDELVYVDPDARAVVGKVEWTKNGEKPKSMAIPASPAAESTRKAGERPRRSHRKYYPWGTYRSMKRAFKIDGAAKEAEPNRPLDEVLPKAVKDPFWD